MLLGSLPAMNAAIVCDGKDLETYNVKQDGTSSLAAFVSSEAGKQFKITVSINSTDFALGVLVFIDGRPIKCKYVRAGPRCSGVHKSPRSILPFQFQERQLVEPDFEDAPVAPGLGVIELNAFRCINEHTWSYWCGLKTDRDPRWGRISELSKKAR